MDSSKLRVTVDLADVPKVVQALTDALEEIHRLRARMVDLEEMIDLLKKPAPREEAYAKAMAWVVAENARVNEQRINLEANLHVALDEKNRLYSDINQLRAKWDAIPWAELQVALDCSMIEEYFCSPGDDKHVAIARAWFDANAPKDAA